MYDQYVKKLVQNNDEYAVEYCTNDKFRQSIDSYMRKGSAENVLKIMYELARNKD